MLTDISNLCKTFPKEYNSFSSMRTRCFRKSHSEYKNYGGRGINVCDRWMEPRKGFRNFLEDMGERPDGSSLDRIDNDLGYSPDNCRWATKREQSENMSTTKVIEYKGKTRTLYEWSTILEIPKPILYNRLFLYKWSVEKAFTREYLPKKPL